MLGRGLPQAVSRKSDTFPLAYSAPTPPSFSQGFREPAPHTPPHGFLQHLHQVGVRPPGAQSPNEEVTHSQPVRSGRFTLGPGLPPHNSPLLRDAQLSWGTPQHTLQPWTVHASQLYCNRGAQVHHPTGPRPTDIGPQALHRPSTQPAFLSRNEERARLSRTPGPRAGRLCSQQRRARAQTHTHTTHAHTQHTCAHTHTTHARAHTHTPHIHDSFLAFRSPCQTPSAALPCTQRWVGSREMECRP